MEVIYMLCPSHDENDQRINRVYNQLRKNFIVVRFYEMSYRKNKDTNPNIVYLKSKREYFNSGLIFQGQDDNVKMYIHDSGTFGLLLCKRWDKSKKVSEVIFDYHDWIPWELTYQIGKFIRLKIAHEFITRMALALHRIFFRNISISKLIGISNEQMSAFKSDYNLHGVDTLVVPNIRPTLAINQSCSSDSFDGVLWIGNVMRGRDLSLLSTFLNKYNELNSKSLKLYLVGSIFDNDYFDYLKNSSSLMYLGGFRTDKDIHEKIRGFNLVGFFYGWVDLHRTGINRIASPNKVYSYMNLRIPVIMGNHLIAVKNILGDREDSVFWIEDYRGFSEVLSKLYDDYTYYYKRSNIEMLSENEVVKKIDKFFE